jgi:hypothetical protein
MKLFLNFPRNSEKRKSSLNVITERWLASKTDIIKQIIPFPSLNWRVFFVLAHSNNPLLFCSPAFIALFFFSPFILMPE